MTGSNSSRSAGRTSWNVKDMEGQMEEIKDFAKQAKLLSEFYNSDSGLKDLTETLKNLKDTQGQRKFSDERVNELVKSIQEGYGKTFKRVNDKILNEKDISAKELGKYLEQINKIKSTSEVLKKVGGISMKASGALNRLGSNLTSLATTPQDKTASLRDAKKFIKELGSQVTDSDTKKELKKFLDNYDESKINDQQYQTQMRKILSSVGKHLQRIGEDKDISIPGEKGDITRLIPKITGDLEKVTKNLKSMQSIMGMLELVGHMVNRIGGSDYSNFSAVVKSWTGKSIGDWTKTMISKLAADRVEDKKDRNKHSSKVGKGLDFIKDGILKIVAILKLQQLWNILSNLLSSIMHLISSPTAMIAVTIVGLVQAINQAMQEGWDKFSEKVGKVIEDLFMKILEKILPKSLYGNAEKNLEYDRGARRGAAKIDEIVTKMRSGKYVSSTGEEEVDDELTTAFAKNYNDYMRQGSKSTPESIKQNWDIIQKEVGADFDAGWTKWLENHQDLNFITHGKEMLRQSLEDFAKEKKMAPPTSPKKDTSFLSAPTTNNTYVYSFFPNLTFQHGVIS